MLPKKFSIFKIYASFLMVNNVIKHDGQGCFMSRLSDSDWECLIANLFVERENLKKKLEGQITDILTKKDEEV